MKRVQPRAMGRAYRVLKRSSHISVAVTAAEPRVPKTGRRRAQGRASVTRAGGRAEPAKEKATRGTRAKAPKAAEQPATETAQETAEE
jgi:hypothetical protein